jgi:proliferating cell nuclear antigen
MMKIQIPCKTLAGLVQSTKELLTDVNFTVNAEGLKMQSMDTAHVALCMLDLPSSCFTSFEVTKPVVIGINMSTMSMALNCLDFGAELLLEYSDCNLYLSTNGERGPRRLKLHTMEIEAEEMSVPSNTPQGVVELDAREFSSLCTDSLKLGDDGSLKLKEDRLEIQTSGDLGEANFCILAGTKTKIFNKGYSEVSSFNWKYLSLFSRAKVCATRVQLHFLAGTPLKVLFPVAEHGTLTFYLAPRYHADE